MQSLGDETSREKISADALPRLSGMNVLGIPTAAVPVCPKKQLPQSATQKFYPLGLSSKRRRWKPPQHPSPILFLSTVATAASTLSTPQNVLRELFKCPSLPLPSFHTGQSNTPSLISMCAHNVLHTTNVSCLRAQLFYSQTGRV